LADLSNWARAEARCSRNGTILGARCGRVRQGLLVHRRLRAGPLPVVRLLSALLWPQILLPTEPGTLRRTTDPGARFGFRPFRDPYPGSG
jgi:hypothetical protein